MTRIPQQTQALPASSPWEGIKRTAGSHPDKGEPAGDAGRLAQSFSSGINEWNFIGPGLTVQTMKPEQFDLSAVPEPLLAQVKQWLDDNASLPQFVEVFSLCPAVASSLPRVLACSPWVASTLARNHGMLRELVSAGCLERSEVLQQDKAPQHYQEMLAALDINALSEPLCQQSLRQLRHREMVRIAWRDLAGMADVEETLRDLSGLADALICTALDWGVASLSPRYGMPRVADGSPARFIVLAMGKLGGGELNFSSDIDLIFMYSDTGDTDGKRSITNEEYFRFLAQRMITALDKTTSDGFVYRVDVRLRPFGDSGPLAVSVPALETYLARNGRDWERYAYVKARVVNEWAEAGAFYDQVLRPFVYRRYLDYGVFGSLREMKALIEAEVERREYRDNLKLGPGGIREIEFIVQSLQLVRGGTIADLRERSLLKVLPRLVKHGCLPETAAAELQAAYFFLRKLENRIQAINDQQTHDVPAKEVDRCRVVLAMGAANWDAFCADLRRHRDIVGRHFQDIVFRGLEEVDGGDIGTPIPGVWDSNREPDEVTRALEKMGFDCPQAAADRLSRYRECSSYRRMDEHGRKRLDALMPAVIAAAAAEKNPGQALNGVMVVIEAIGRRSAYFALLNENPAALKRLISMCAMSDFLSGQLAMHPLLLDELLDPRIFLDAPDREDLVADLESRRVAAADDDEEVLFNAVSNFKQAAAFRVAVADLSGSLDLMKVSDRLTDIAELVLESAYRLSWRELVSRHGTPRCEDEAGKRDARFAIIAYGKLGGLELGYSSDLDLVFLHDSDGANQMTDGPKPLENPVFFARLTRRIIHILTLSTSTGALYEVDTRLRPSGASGLMVSSLAAFLRYQKENAWTWEHQALLRSRAVAGHRRVREAFEQLRIHSLTEYVHRDRLMGDVVEMRQRMRKELSQGSADLFDIKQDAGGVADIEFIVQYLVLNSAQQYPELLRYPDNIRQLESLAQCGVLDADDATQLSDAYRWYRRHLHHLALAGRKGFIDTEAANEFAGFVRGIWQKVFSLAGA